MNFSYWLEAKEFTGIDSDTIKWWANYAKYMNFKTEQEARDWVFHKREFADKQMSAKVFGVDGPEFNRAFADAIPIYQSGKSFKIGKRIRDDKRLRLSHLKVKLPDWEYINEVAQANGVHDYKVHKMTWIPVRFTIADKNDYYINQPNVKELAYKIKENGWIEAVIYEWKSKNIIEGQHRARAMKILGFNTVPGIGIEYLE